MIRPLFAAFNQCYREMDPSALLAAVSQMAKALNPNARGSTALASDDLICWFRTLGFLDDPDFLKACEPYNSSGFIRAKLWRVYTYCWAVKQSPRYRMVDLGCYDGKVVHIAQRYAPDREWYVYDLFEGEKKKHGATLCDEVKKRLGLNAVVTQGRLPDAIKDMGNIGFIHVDLNDGETEIACLEKLWPEVVSGGIILLDDYGWSRYRHSHDLHKAFFKERGHEVLELPTGVGLVVRK